MKKFIKAFFSLVVAVVCLIGFTGCKTPVSATTVSVDKVESSNGVSTNGGVTVVHNGYMYFINGTRANDGKGSSKNKLGTICRVKLDVATGEIDDSTYEVVVKDLVGFDYGSIYFFGDFMYYTSPSKDVNYKGNVLFNKTRFMRYDLVNKKSYTIYTTKKNSSSDKIDYAYYVVGENLNLVVYESESSTITSLKIGTTTKTNYKITDVKSCLLSENQGKCETEGALVDANNFVFYTKQHSVTSDTEVYRTSPQVNNSFAIANDGYDIALLSIKNGKLIYSYSSKIYAKSILGTNADKLTIDLADVISHNTYTYILFMKQQDGSDAVLYYNENDGAIVIVRWVDGVKLDPYVITNIGKISSSNSNSNSSSEKEEVFGLIGLTTIEEVVATDDPETEDVVEETETETVTYLLYVKSKVVYRLEIEREGNIVEYAEPVKLSTTSMVIPTTLLVPEVIGTHLYIFGYEVDEKDKETGKVYLYRVDITIDSTTDLEDLENKGAATLVGIKQK